MHTETSLNISISVNNIDYVTTEFFITYVEAPVLRNMSSPPCGPVSGRSYIDVSYSGSFTSADSIGCFYRVVAPSTDVVPRVPSQWIEAPVAVFVSSTQVRVAVAFAIFWLYMIGKTISGSLYIEVRDN